ncbi:MAG: acyl-CoA dehydrogenase family protein [Parasphingorhabdus sp.]|nr:acyl-CoA dehydrogenase family protein [Parasphingorhabdus sp.]
MFDIVSLGGIGTSEEQIELMDVATNFCRDKSPIDKVRRLIDDEHGYDPAIWAEIAALGWLAIAIPEQHKGVGLGIAEVVPIAEQMGRRLMSSPFGATQVAVQALLAGASETQRINWLPHIAEGAAATLALHEADGGWQLSNVAASAMQTGEVLKLSGVKRLVQWADQAALIIASVSIDGAPRLVLLPRENIPAEALRRETVIDETARSYELTLDGITLPASALFPAEQTAAALEKIALTAALLQSAEMAGGTQAVIDYTIEYLKTRKQFGKVIGGFQALKHPTVDNYMAYEKARTLLYSAAYCANDQGVGEIAIRMAAAQSHKAYATAADRAIQFHGAFGFTHDCDAQLYRRQAIMKGALFGDAAYHRAKVAELLF